VTRCECSTCKFDQCEECKCYDDWKTLEHNIRRLLAALSVVLGKDIPDPLMESEWYQISTSLHKRGYSIEHFSYRGAKEDGWIR